MSTKAKQQKPRRGRPPKAATEVMQDPLGFRFTEAEEAELRRAARDAGEILTAWGRKVLLSAARAGKVLADP